jgi:proline racemase
MPDRLQIIDSHTEGEPTRTVVAGFPPLKGSTMAERRESFRTDCDHLRCGLVKEPRGHDAVVGALLTPPVNQGSDAGVIFFNDVGYLGMCGHGTIGVAETLRYLGRAGGDTVVLDTPVGTVKAWFEKDRMITIENVPSRRLTTGFQVEVGARPGGFPAVLRGDLAYGGNGFFIAEVPLELMCSDRLDDLLAYTMAVRQAMGELVVDGVLIDHIELYANQPCGARNFVLCPGRAYDRSPCGTGTSAKVACLALDGHLAEGVVWRQESVTGGVFLASYRWDGDMILPRISGRAFVTAELTPVFDEADPFRYGLG